MAFEDIRSFRYAGRPKPPIPQATRRAVEKRAAGLCEQCGDRPPLGSKLELHHLHYNTEGCETEDDLIACCRSCHRAEHIDAAGYFWVDPEELQNFAATYE
jgi:5-methylcytosine-specific restriction endonuclease McrA